MPVNEGNLLRKVVVCSPDREYFEPGDKEAHNIGQRADRARARQQHGKLTKLMRDGGVEVFEIEELSGHPNSVFTRDTALCLGDGYVGLRMGLETRRGEERRMARFLDSLGYKRLGVIKAPGTVEGGDVVLAGEVAFLGLSSRTNRAGAAQLSSILRDRGFQVRTVHVPPPFLHLGGAMSMVGPDTVLCTQDLFRPDLFRGFDLIPLSSNGFTCGNVICLGQQRLLVEKSNQVALNALSERGYEITSLDLGEFLKGRGGPTCLILPVERGGEGRGHPQS